MDKLSRGRKSMTRAEQGGQEGVSPVAFKERSTMGIGGRVLPYLHMIFPVLPVHLLCDSAKNNGHYLGWKVNVTE